MKKEKLDPDYIKLLATEAGKHWQRIGLDRRAGVCVPLFSIHSEKSIGVGEFLDIKLMIDWCKLTGMTLLQFLPLNDVGFNFFPYDAQSAIALEPMHLSLHDLKGVTALKFQSKISELRKNFSCRGAEFDDKVKKAKLFLLGEIYESVHAKLPVAFYRFVEANKFWLEDYALFKVLQERFAYASWEHWPEPFRKRDSHELAEFSRQHTSELEFYRWLQWQLFEQLSEVKTYAEKHGVLLIGDMPFLVARNSDYVWAQQESFKLDLLAGAPPDLDFSKGQRWGMPPYHWEKMASHLGAYLAVKLKYAENFYHLFRIDHVVGVFRIWTIAKSQPPIDEGLFGTFDPEDESKWEAQGVSILRHMLKSTTMLPTAEDLGTIPSCAPRVMDALGIPGMYIQRWVRHWDSGYDFTHPDEYRPSSVAWSATHDTSPLRTWWRHEIGTVNARTFEHWCGVYQVDFQAVRDRLFDEKNSSEGRLRWKESLKENRAGFFDVIGKAEHEMPRLVMLYDSSIDEKEKFLKWLGIAQWTEKLESKSPEVLIIEKLLQARSIFSMHLLQDWLSMDPKFHLADDPEYRINVPGTLNAQNWHIRIPFSLEQMKKMKLNAQIRSLIKSSGRI